MSKCKYGQITITARLARLSTKAVKLNLFRCLEILYQRGELAGEKTYFIDKRNGKIRVSHI